MAKRELLSWVGHIGGNKAVTLKQFSLKNQEISMRRQNISALRSEIKPFAV